MPYKEELKMRGQIAFPWMSIAVTQAWQDRRGESSILEEFGKFWCSLSLITLKHNLYFSCAAFQVSHILFMPPCISRFTFPTALEVRLSGDLKMSIFRRVYAFSEQSAHFLAFPGNLVHLLINHLSFFVTVFWGTFPCYSCLLGSLGGLPVCNIFYW